MGLHGVKCRLYRVAVGFAHGFFCALWRVVCRSALGWRKTACSKALRGVVAGCKDGVRTPF